MTFIKTLGLIILTIFLFQKPVLSNDGKVNSSELTTNEIKCLQPKPLSDTSLSASDIHLAEVKCGFGQTCDDGYKCCKGTANFFCCPTNKVCNETDDDCKDTNSKN